MMTTTPYDARRATRIREAYDAAYHLAHVVKDYPNVRKDGFGAAHLERIEKLLTDTAATIAEMVTAERNPPSSEKKIYGRHYGTDRAPLSEVVGDPGPELVRITEPTVPVSLLEQIRTRTDCD